MWSAAMHRHSGWSPAIRWRNSNDHAGFPWTKTMGSTAALVDVVHPMTVRSREELALEREHLVRHPTGPAARSIFNHHHEPPSVWTCARTRPNAATRMHEPRGSPGFGGSGLVPTEPQYTTSRAGDQSVVWPAPHRPGPGIEIEETVLDTYPYHRGKLYQELYPRARVRTPLSAGRASWTTAFRAVCGIVASYAASLTGSPTATAHRALVTGVADRPQHSMLPSRAVSTCAYSQRSLRPTALWPPLFVQPDELPRHLNQLNRRLDVGGVRVW